MFDSVTAKVFFQRSISGRKPVPKFVPSIEVMIDLIWHNHFKKTISICRVGESTFRLAEKNKKHAGAVDVGQHMKGNDDFDHIRLIYCLSFFVWKTKCFEQAVNKTNKRYFGKHEHFLVKKPSCWLHLARLFYRETLYAASGLLVRLKHRFSFWIVLFIFCFLLNIFYQIFVMFNLSGFFHCVDCVKLFFLLLDRIFSSFEIFINLFNGTNLIQKVFLNLFFKKFRRNKSKNALKAFGIGEPLYFIKY